MAWPPVSVPAEVRARWWVASGGPWTAAQVPVEEAVGALRSALGDGEVDLVHASVFLRLRKAGHA